MSAKGAVSASQVSAARRRAPRWLHTANVIARRDSLRAHPGFPAAVRASASGLVGLYEANPLLNRIVNDRGRAIFGFLALYLDATPDSSGIGLTAARLTNACQEVGLCSRGRAKALLALMRWGGYLAPVEPRFDRREKPLAPTPRMWAMFRMRWHNQLSALSPISETAAAALAALDTPSFLRSMAVEFGDAYLAGFRITDFAPAIARYADRDGAIMIFMSLLAAGAQGGPPPTVADLARRFQLSRAHVLQLMREAMEDALVVRAGEPGEEGSGFSLLPAGEAAVVEFITGGFIAFDGCAGDALRAHAALAARP